MRSELSESKESKRFVLMLSKKCPIIKTISLPVVELLAKVYARNEL